MTKLKEKLLRDIDYLKTDQVPMEQSGLKVEKLDYECESDGEEKLNDDDVMALSAALLKNNCF
jgi:hypothetical protein